MQFQAPQSQQKPSDHDKLETSDPNCHNFQTILIFYGRGFANRNFTETDSPYAPCPDCPDLCPYFYLRKPSKATCNLLQLTAGYRQVSNRKCHFLPSKCQVNAKLKTQKPTFYLRKLWKNHGFTTLNCVFTTFSNLTPP